MGMAYTPALDTHRESILGVCSKRIQAPGGTGEREAQLRRRSVSVNSQRVCYTDSLISDRGGLKTGVQPLGIRMKYTYEVPEEGQGIHTWARGGHRSRCCRLPQSPVPADSRAQETQPADRLADVFNVSGLRE